jgi:hypothetical protein
MKKRRVVHYVSSFSVGTLHGMINRALLQMLVEQDDYRVECYTPASAEPSLRRAVGSERVSRWHRIFVNSGAGHGAMLFRYLLSAFHNVRILLKSRPDDTIFYNFNNVFSLSLIDRINRRLKRNVVVCCHGEMEYLANASKHSRLYKRLMIKLTTDYFNRQRVPAEGLRFLVFGDVIKENLKPYLSDALYARLRSVDHPVIVSENRFAAPSAEADGRIDVGMVGIINAYKGSDSYPSLAESLRDVPELRFHAVGHFQCDSKPFEAAGIEIPADPTKPLSDEEFRKSVEVLDFLLFLYPTDTYKLIASGAILDCLRFRRPVIALRTDYFDYLFRKFGAFGYLADSMEELQTLLRRASTLSRDFPFDMIAERLSPTNLPPLL